AVRAGMSLLTWHLYGYLDQRSLGHPLHPLSAANPVLLGGLPAGQLRFSLATIARRWPTAFSTGFDLAHERLLSRGHHDMRDSRGRDSVSSLDELCGPVRTRFPDCTMAAGRTISIRSLRGLYD